MELTFTELQKIRDKLKTFLRNDIEFLGEYKDFDHINGDLAFYLNKTQNQKPIKLGYLQLDKDQKQDIKYVCYRIIKQRERYKQIQSEIIRKYLGDDILKNITNENEYLIVHKLYEKVFLKRGSAEGAVKEVAYLLDKPESGLTDALAYYSRVSN
jgi:hypothetical protein